MSEPSLPPPPPPPLPLLTYILRIVDERLLGLDLDIPQDVKSSSGPTPPDSDAASCKFQIRDETTDDLRSESISTSEITSASAYTCTPKPPFDYARTPKPPPDITQVPSEESELAVLEYRHSGPLRVVNRSEDDDMTSGSDSEGESVYSSHEGEGKDGDGDSMVPKLVFGSDSSESESASHSEPDVGTGTGLPVQDEGYSDMLSCNHYEGLPNPHPRVSFGMLADSERKSCCTKCVGDCPVHVYVRELEGRVEELVEENRRLRVQVREA